MIDLAQRDATGIEAIANRRAWKRGCVLSPREPFFLGCGHNVAIDQKRSGAIVIERGNTENVQRCQTQMRLEDRIDERRQGSAFDQQENRTEEQQEEERRENKKPPTLPRVGEKLVDQIKHGLELPFEICRRC